MDLALLADRIRLEGTKGKPFSPGATCWAGLVPRGLKTCLRGQVPCAWSLDDSWALVPKLLRPEVLTSDRGASLPAPPTRKDPFLQAEESASREDLSPVPGTEQVAPGSAP